MSDEMRYKSDEVNLSEHDIVSSSLTQTEQRSLIFHLLYALYAFDYDISLEALVDNFYHGFGVLIPNDGAVFTTTAAIARDRKQLDQEIIPLIENWRLDRLGIATKLILRLSLWELMNTQIDSAVIINEAVELAKCFAEKDAYKFINGVLDEYVKRSNA